MTVAGYYGEDVALAGKFIIDPDFTTAGVASARSTSPLVINRPPNVKAGDLIVIHCTANAANVASFAISGFTAVDVGSVNRFIFHKVATSSEPTTYSITKSETSTVFAIALCIKASKSKNIVIGALASSAQNISIPSVNAPTANSLQIVFANVSSGDVNPTFSAPSGFETIVNKIGARQGTSGMSGSVWIAVFYRYFANAGATGTVTVNATSNGNRGHQIAVGS